MNEKTFVIAGTHAQFTQWRNQTKTEPTSVTYLADARQLMGVTQCSVTLVGTYYDRKDWVYVSQALAIIATVGELVYK